MKFINMLRQPYLDQFDGIGSGSIIDDPIPEPEPSPEPEPTPEPTPEPEPTPQAIKVKYNHEEMELPYEEAIQHIQKGMNYDKAVERARIEAEAKSERLINVLRDSFGFEGTPEEIADALTAQTQNITVEEARAQREFQERENEELLQAKGEAEYYKGIAFEKFKADDLAKIKSVYPDAPIKHLDELGADFYKTAAITKDPVLAYDIINAKKQRETKPIPQDIGAVNSSSSKEKDFYTPAEVDKLTDKDYDNPKLMEIVRKSMLKWK